MPEDEINYRNVFEAMFRRSGDVTFIIEEAANEICVMFYRNTGFLDEPIIAIYRETYFGVCDKNELWGRLVQTIMFDGLNRCVERSKKLFVQ